MMNTISQWENGSELGYIWLEQDLRLVMDDYGTLQVIPFCDWCQQNFEII